MHVEESREYLRTLLPCGYAGSPKTGWALLTDSRSFEEDALNV
jgi:hypothetical protein